MKNMGLITIFAVYAMLHKSVLGCGQSQSQNSQDESQSEDQSSFVIAPPIGPPVLWQLCCLGLTNNNIYNCESRTAEKAEDFDLNCSSIDDIKIIFLTCLEGQEPLCRLYPIDGMIFYDERYYETATQVRGVQIALMLNKVSNSQFFSKTKDEMRNVMTEHKFSNFVDNNYWIGLDQMNTLTNQDTKKSVYIYVNSSSSFNIRYDEFKVEDYDKNYNLTLDKFVGSADRNLLKSGIEFKGTDNFGESFCKSSKNNNPSGWWYSEIIENDNPVLCSNAILTTNNGNNGWGKDRISSALLTFAFI